MNFEMTTNETPSPDGMSRPRRRLALILNLGALLAILICIASAERFGPRPLLLTGVAAALALLIVSFRGLFWKTGLWHITHAPVEKLDERQVQITHEALRRSYAIFTVLSLSIFLVHTVLDERSVFFNRLSLMPVIAALIYLAHILPGSVLAWMEKEV